jgi:hypothetical protein
VARNTWSSKFQFCADSYSLCLSGCVFKIAQDVYFEKVGKWLYGGKAANHELAAKASGHELNGATRLFSEFKVGTITVPLQSIVDVAGNFHCWIFIGANRVYRISYRCDASITC